MSTTLPVNKRILLADFNPTLRSALALLLETRLDTLCLDSSINSGIIWLC